MNAASRRVGTRAPRRQAYLSQHAGRNRTMNAVISWRTYLLIFLGVPLRFGEPDVAYTPNGVLDPTRRRRESRLVQAWRKA